MNPASVRQFPSAARRHQYAAIAALLVAWVALPGCTARQREGTASSFLLIESIVALRGGEQGQESAVLDSDVYTNNTVFSDLGRVALRLAMKDPGSITSPSVPTSNNFITVTRYHVKYVRTDGRNTPGVDVPHEFTGATTVTVTEAGGSVVLTLVRVQAKLEEPLRALRNTGGAVAISTIAEITLFGQDQTGRDVSVKGAITVNFADFADAS